MSAETRRILLEAAVIFILGVVLGLSFNYRLLMNTFGGTPPKAPTESRISYPQPASLAELRRFVGAGAVLVDARAPELYGEGHLPGAISLPLADAGERFPSFRAGVPPDAVVIVYCSGYGCPDSFDLGVRLLAEGYLDVRVFEGGYPEWHDAGLPVERGEP